MGRRLGATSVVALLAVAALVLGGASIARAVSVAIPIQTFMTGSWAPPSADPSGAAWIADDGYLFVVDTNENEPDANGWQFDVHTGTAVSRGTGVEEPSGIDYDPDTDTLFISDDNGLLFVFLNFDEPNEQVIEIDVSNVSSDTEDPAYNRDNDRLYWVDGAGAILFEMIPVGGWGGGNDVINQYSLDPLASGADWEGLAWDPSTGNLLIGRSNINNTQIFQTDTQANLIDTVDVSDVDGLTRINGLGVAPASFDPSEQSLWITDRNGSALFEVTFDGTTPPTTIPTSTTQPTTTTTQPTTTTTQPTTTSTTTTTTQPTTTTTTQPTTTSTTTTTTQPTTTTTQPTTTSSTTTTQPPPSSPPDAPAFIGVGDFNADGRSDTVTYNEDDGRVWVHVSSGSNLTATEWTRLGSPTEWFEHLVGDFDGDGRDDIAHYRGSTGNWTVSRSTSTGFVNTTWTTLSSPTVWETHLVGDFDGDGKDDIAHYKPSTGNWTISRSTGTAFTNSTWTTFSPAAKTGWTEHLVGDFNNDGRDDIAHYRGSTGNWTVSKSMGSTFSNTTWTTFSPAAKTGWTEHLVGDFNNDGRDDIAHYRGSTGNWTVSRSSGAKFTNSTWTTFSGSAITGWSAHLVGDFNGDDRDDIAHYRASTGNWTVSRSTGAGFTNSTWTSFAAKTGWLIHLVGDFNEDTRDDIAHFRATTSTWTVSRSLGGSFTNSIWHP